LVRRYLGKTTGNFNGPMEATLKTRQGAENYTHDGNKNYLPSGAKREIGRKYVVRVAAGSEWSFEHHGPYNSLIV
jgi:hypothetical protein